MYRGLMPGTMRWHGVRRPACADIRHVASRRPSMRRPVLFVTCLCLCAFATGMTLVALAQEVTRPPIPLDDHPTGDAAANVDLVRRFYGAAEAVLATGEAAPLDAFVAPDLTEHPAQPGAASGRDGFVRALLALRA